MKNEISKTDTINNGPIIIYSDPSVSKYKIKPDIEPVFVGGMAAMNLFISTNLKYPKEAVNHSIQGLLLVRLTISKDGTAKFKELVWELGYGCEEEILRIIKRMPKWKPAVSQNQPVDSAYVMKVNFRLSE